MFRRPSSVQSNSNTTNNGTLSTTTKTPKRRNERNILTFYEKIAVIRYYDETNVSRNSLAKMFHCCTTQIRRILERKQDLLQQLATLSEADASIIIEEMTRKRRKFEMSAISFILHQWVQRCRLLQLRKTITNETLKEIALKMAAILNLPTFRPSYRWLNRFRAKYKYNDEDLGVGINNENAITGELSVEDIIIEFKDALPSFMQKEISAITQQTIKIANDNDVTITSKNSVDPMELTKQNSSTNVNRNERESENENANGKENIATPTIVINDNSLDNFQSTKTTDKSKSCKRINEKKKKIGDKGDTSVSELYKKPPLTTFISNTATNESVVQAESKANEETVINPSSSATTSTIQIAEIAMEPLQLPLTPPSPPPTQTQNLSQNFQMMNASISALFDIVFPHLAIVHQFALLNSDIHALELITKLGVHMQAQAANGAYKQLSLTGSNNNNNSHNNSNNNNNHNISSNSASETISTMEIATKKYCEDGIQMAEVDIDIDGEAETQVDDVASVDTVDAVDANVGDTIYPDIDDIVLLE